MNPVSRSKLIVIACLGLAASGLAQVTNQPINWSQAPVGPLGFITGMAIHPTSPSLKVLRTDVGGAYRWNSANSTWIPITDKLMRDQPEFTWGIESIALDPSNPSLIYIAAGDVYRTSDGGANWTPLGLRKPDGNLVLMEPNDDWRQSGERLAVDPNKGGQVIYFGSRVDGLFRSTNGGATWSQVSSFPTAGSYWGGISFVLFDKSTGSATTPSQTLYAGVIGSGVYRSQDGGATWAPLSNQPSPATYNPLRGAMDSAGRLFVTYNEGSGWTGASGKIYRYTSGTGTDVTPSGYPAYAWCGISVDPANSQRVVAGTWNWANSQSEVLFTTLNGGASWSASPAVFNQPSWYVTWGPQNWTSSVLIDPENPARTWKTDGFCVYATDNNGAATQTFNLRSTGVELLVPQHLRKLPGATSPLIYSVSDKIGFTLTDLTTPPTTKWLPGTFGNATGIDYCATTPSFVVRMGADSNGNRIAGFSTNSGSTFTNFTGWPSGKTGIGAIATSATSTQHMIMATEGSAGAIYYTSNRGGTWKKATGPGAYWFSSVFCYSVPIASDRVNGTTFYCYSIDQSRFWRSTNSGKNWTLVSSNVLPWDWQCVVKAVPGRANEVWAAFMDSGSLWRSVDGGANWSQIARVSGLSGFGFGKSAPAKTHPTVFIYGRVDAGGQGVFRSDDLIGTTGTGASASWTKIDSNTTPIPGATWDCVEGDPDVYNKVYIACGGRGLFVGTP